MGERSRAANRHARNPPARRFQNYTSPSSSTDLDLDGRNELAEADEMQRWRDANVRKVRADGAASCTMAGLRLVQSQERISSVLGEENVLHASARDVGRSREGEVMRQGRYFIDDGEVRCRRCSCH